VGTHGSAASTDANRRFSTPPMRFSAIFTRMFLENIGVVQEYFVFFRDDYLVF
jgi:hypothetical protein